MRIALLAATLALILPSAAQSSPVTWANHQDPAAVQADKHAHITGHAGTHMLAAGEDISTAIPIPGLPFSVGGNTCSFADDYDEVCPYYAPGSPDVVYSYSPAVSQVIDIDLCASLYDTKVYVYDGSTAFLVACNDDAGCGITGYQSQLLLVPVTAGHTYYIVVDGYSGDCGDYVLDVAEHQPCLACQPYDQPEGEPTCTDGYIDTYNAGCNATPEKYTPVTCGTICGTTGNYTTPDGQFRDTDWYEITVGPGNFTYSGVGDAFSLRLFVLSAVCPPTSFGTVQTSSCASGSINFTGPGTFHLFASTSGFTGVPCGSNYRLDITGPGILACQATPTRTRSWGALRVLYR